MTPAQTCAEYVSVYPSHMLYISMSLLMFHVCTDDVSANDYNQIQYVMPNNGIVDTLIYFQVDLAYSAGAYNLQIYLPGLASINYFDLFYNGETFI